MSKTGHIKYHYHPKVAETASTLQIYGQQFVCPFFFFQRSPGDICYKSVQNLQVDASGHGTGLINQTGGLFYYWNKIV